jgi:hypothetical protein
MLLESVQPEYETPEPDPVFVELTIATDGSISAAKFIEGPLSHRDAALAAVRQWRYRPTLVNGKPVEVVTMVAV